jgi:1-acyl-sn-glycerol-3-phosphate acyltransferase
MEVPPQIPRKRRLLLRWLGKAILRLSGWRLELNLPDTPKFIIIAAPHTSNWDFVYGMAAILALDLDIHWYAKHTLFQGVWGGFFRALGGLPVDRSAAGQLVAQTTRIFAEHEQLIIALAPEGTRRHVPKWKRGFYHMARAAGVPVVTACLDYGRRVCGTGPVFVPTGDWDADMAPVFAYYRSVRARRPELFGMDSDV